MYICIYTVIIYVEIKYQELCTAWIRMGSQPPKLAASYGQPRQEVGMEALGAPFRRASVP